MPERPQITLLHATTVAVEPVHKAMGELWPEAETSNLLDDGLTAERARSEDLTAELSERFGRLVTYALSTGPAGILTTCSAFGPAIERAAARTSIPIVKPNEAMFEEALSEGPAVGMVATFSSSVPTMAEEFYALAAARQMEAQLQTVIAAGAMAALRDGDGGGHDDLVARAATELAGCDAIVLAHFSTARAVAAAGALVDVPVLTAPASAVLALRRRVDADIRRSGRERAS